MFWQLATGRIVSTIVTVAVQVEVLPLLSVTVKVTVLAPTLAQVKLLGDTDSVAMPQASVDPLLSCDPVTLTVPEAFRYFVRFWQLATGRTVSITVTVPVHVEVLPLLSVTVKVTVLAPTLAQVKLEGLTDSVAMPQASVEPLLTWAAVTLTVPDAFRYLVMFLQLATGRTVSNTVTVALQVDELLLLSVTVKVTVLAPTLAQVKLEGLTDSVAMPQASVEPLLS